LIQLGMEIAIISFELTMKSVGKEVSK
jgi:hypothetical protein